MKLVIPNTIQVGGHTYSIVFNDELEDGNDHAIVNHRLLRIELNPDRPPSQRVEALIHEWLHIINNVYANNRLAETDIEDLSQGLYQVFQQLGIEFDYRLIPQK